MPISKSSLFAALPPPWREDLRSQNRAACERAGHKLVVLDDDPTGTQTVHHVPVLTTWEVETLRAEFARPGSCFYLLTNSRSLTAGKAGELNRQIGRNLLLAGASAHGVTLVSRSDSTLRGHYPAETDALAEELGPFDATVLIPYFEAGGRYTIHDTHYVAEGDALVPAAETPFAHDAAFGYRNSDLREYVEEKTGGRVLAKDVVSISLEDVRLGGPTKVAERLASLGGQRVCVVNAAAPWDLDVFVAGLLSTPHKRFLFRTAAQFVAARLGLEPQPLWRPKRKLADVGGLTVVGSHVPKTTTQLEKLLGSSDALPLEVSVRALLSGALDSTALSAKIDDAVASGRDVVLFTSRALIIGDDPASSLDIGNRVSAALVEIVSGLRVRPSYLIAKGGVTSSNLATKGLGVRRALVLGQLLPGVPVWELGSETKLPGLAYVVFPGNVGGPEALAEAAFALSSNRNS